MHLLTALELKTFTVQPVGKMPLNSLYATQIFTLKISPAFLGKFPTVAGPFVCLQQWAAGTSNHHYNFSLRTYSSFFFSLKKKKTAKNNFPPTATGIHVSSGTDVNITHQTDRREKQVPTSQVSHRLQIWLANTELSYLSQRAKDSIFHWYNQILCMQCCCQITDPNSCILTSTIQNFVLEPVSILLTRRQRFVQSSATELIWGLLRGPEGRDCECLLLYCISGTYITSLLDNRFCYLLVALWQHDRLPE